MSKDEIKTVAICDIRQQRQQVNKDGYFCLDQPSCLAERLEIDMTLQL